MTYAASPTDHRDQLKDAVVAIVERAGTTSGVPVSDPGGDRDAFRALADAGFATLGIDEDRGGSGGDIVDALDVVTSATRLGATTPLVEHGLLASWLMAEAGISVPDGLATVAIATDAITALDDGERTVLHGLLVAVPWATVADAIVVVLPGVGETENPRIAIIATAERSVTIRSGTDLTGAAMNDVMLDGTTVFDVLSLQVTADDVRRRGALGYTAAIAGAGRAICDASRRHANDRTQFGRPLAKFQAVAQLLAELEESTTAVEIAAYDAARDASSPSGPVSAAAAAILASTTIKRIAAAGHQIHGAIGFTAECELGRSTTSLWSWRDRYGSAEYWADELATRVLDDGVDVWALLTGQADEEGGRW